MYAFFQMIYKLFQVSFYFWIYLLRGLVLYSVIPALSAMLLTINDILADDDEGDVKEKYKKYFHMYKRYKLQSFMFTSIIIFSNVVLFYLNKMEGNLSIILSIVAIYILFFTAVTLTYCVNYLVIKQLSFKQSFALAFISVVRNIMRTLLLIVVIFLLYLAAYWNLVFFVFFGPFIFGLVSKFLVQPSLPHK